LHLKSGPLQLLDAFYEVAALVLVLAALRQAVFVGCLDADKCGIESGLRHPLDQFGIIGQVDRRFGAERHAKLALAPFDQCRQHFRFDLSLVADEIVVYEKDALAPAQCVKAI
jgi:hypothetical protein